MKGNRPAGTNPQRNDEKIPARERQKENGRQKDNKGE
jgi:hypothetical protein